MDLLISCPRGGPQEEGLRHGRPVRDGLTAMGITLEDTPGGTIWRSG